jgi:hypothetical protein
VVFLYGAVGAREQTDEAVFKEMRAAKMGENVNDVLKRTEREKTTEMRFISED